MDQAESLGGKQPCVVGHHLNGAFVVEACDDAGVPGNQRCKRLEPKLVC